MLPHHRRDKSTCIPVVGIPRNKSIHGEVGRHVLSDGSVPPPWDYWLFARLQRSCERAEPLREGIKSDELFGERRGHAG